MNEHQLVKVARRFGFQIEFAPPLDLWAGLRGCWKPVEVKAPRGTYTSAQVEFMEKCERNKNPHETWRDVSDVVKASYTWGVNENSGC